MPRFPEVAVGDGLPGLAASAALPLLASGAVELLDLTLRPGEALVAAPSVPSLPSLPLLVPGRALLVHLMPLEVRDHPADRVLRERLAVHQVSRPSDADGGHAALALRLRLADLEGASGVVGDGLRRLRVDVLDGLRERTDRGLDRLPLAAHRVGDRDRLVLRISLVDELRDLVGDAVAERVLHLRTEHGLRIRLLRDFARLSRLLWLRVHAADEPID